MNIYKNSTAKVQLERVGEEFVVKRGVRQGDPLSPKLFSAVLEDIFKKFNWDEYGININGKRLNHLRFADDLVIFAENPLTLQTMLQELTDESRRVGLVMNISKTKAMTNRSHVTIQVGEENIEYVEEYIYLGHLISPHNQMSLEVDRRVANTWNRYWSLKEVMKSKSIPINEKSKVFNACILPCLTYACQTWSCTKKDMQKISTCQHGMERSMLDIRKRDRVSLSKIRKRTKVTDAKIKIKQLKWRWTGHMIRQQIDKWTADITDWYPRDGERKRGRQIKRWEDDLPKSWRRLARDRKMWKNLEEAYVGRQPDHDKI